MWHSLSMVETQVSPLAVVGKEIRVINVDEDGFEKMINRFLTWKLPKDFSPDCGIQFTPPAKDAPDHFGPVGTNLFTAEQAKQMLFYALYGKELKTGLSMDGKKKYTGIFVQRMNEHKIQIRLKNGRLVWINESTD